MEENISTQVCLQIAQGLFSGVGVPPVFTSAIQREIQSGYQEQGCKGGDYLQSGVINERGKRGSDTEPYGKQLKCFRGGLVTWLKSHDLAALWDTRSVFYAQLSFSDAEKKADLLEYGI